MQTSRNSCGHNKPIPVMPHLPGFCFGSENICFERLSGPFRRLLGVQVRSINGGKNQIIDRCLKSVPMTPHTFRSGNVCFKRLPGPFRGLLGVQVRSKIGKN